MLHLYSDWKHQCENEVLFHEESNDMLCEIWKGIVSWNNLCKCYKLWLLWHYGKFHIDLVNSLSISENKASISPLCIRSGGLSSAHLEIRAKPCCGPKLLGPNCATKNNNLCLNYISNSQQESISFYALTKDEWYTTANCFFAVKYCELTENRIDLLLSNILPKKT